MRKTKEDAEQTRQALLDAALRVFGERGYAATTLDDIAREARVTRGALYWHFSAGKPAIYRALFAERQAPALAVIDEAFTVELPPLEKLRRMMVRSLELLEEDAGYRALINLMLYAEPAPEVEAGLAAKVVAVRRLRGAVVNLLSAAIADRSVRPDIDPELAALAALSLINGVTFMWTTDDQSFAPRRQAGALVNLFIQGLVLQPPHRAERQYQ
jgi:AcrR family transcriptional regulator